MFACRYQFKNPNWYLGGVTGGIFRLQNFVVAIESNYIWEHVFLVLGT